MYKVWTLLFYSQVEGPPGPSGPSVGFYCLYFLYCFVLIDVFIDDIYLLCLWFRVLQELRDTPDQEALKADG